MTGVTLRLGWTYRTNLGRRSRKIATTRTPRQTVKVCQDRVFYGYWDAINRPTVAWCFAKLREQIIPQRRRAEGVEDRTGKRDDPIVVREQEMPLAGMLGQLAFLAGYPQADVIDSVEIEVAGDRLFSEAGEAEGECVVGAAVAIEVELELSSVVIERSHGGMFAVGQAQIRCGDPSRRLPAHRGRPC